MKLKISSSGLYYFIFGFVFTVVVTPTQFFFKLPSKLLTDVAVRSCPSRVTAAASATRSRATVTRTQRHAAAKANHYIIAQLSTYGSTLYTYICRLARTEPLGIHNTC